MHNIMNISYQSDLVTVATAAFMLWIFFQSVPTTVTCRTQPLVGIAGQCRSMRQIYSYNFYFVLSFAYDKMSLRHTYIFVCIVQRTFLVSKYWYCELSPPYSLHTSAKCDTWWDRNKAPAVVNYFPRTLTTQIKDGKTNFKSSLFLEL